MQWWMTASEKCLSGRADEMEGENMVPAGLPATFAGVRGEEVDVSTGALALEVKEWFSGFWPFWVRGVDLRGIWTIEVVNGKITRKVPHPPTSLWPYEGSNGNFAVI